jgi:putative SOS response-associated peptidase YedK
MCVNYRSVTSEDLDKQFEAKLADDDYREEVWQDYAAPIIRATSTGKREAIIATFGMVPKWHIPPHVRPWTSMNARAESIAEKKSFAPYWKKHQHCLIPMRNFMEPCYESGKAVRWSIGMANGDPFAVAGLWRAWPTTEGKPGFSFTAITVGADSHSLMKRFHKPEDEKRSLVIVPPDEYDAWLQCGDVEIARSFLRLFPAEQMTAHEAPVPSRAKAKSEHLKGYKP